MKVNAWLSTDVGNVRSNNEDSGWLGVEQGVFVVADGVGGRMAGEVASATVAEVVERKAAELSAFANREDDEFDEGHRDAISSKLVQVLGEANEAIFARSREDGYPGGMATTADVLLLTEQAAFIGHVGDSRVYLLRDNEIYRITEDHTFAESLRNDASVSPESLKGMDLSRFEHVLTRSLGAQPRVDVDVLFVELKPGDRFLMCTDGLTDYLNGNELLEYATRYRGEELLAELTREAKSRGGGDNITIVHVETLAEREETPRRRPTRSVQMDTIGKIDFLEDVALFDGLKPVEILKLLRFVFERHHRKGTVIFRQDDPVDNLYIIARGAVSLIYDGCEIARMERGSHFGEHSMFLQRGRSTDAVVAQDDTLLLAIPTTKVEQFNEAFPEIGNRILWNMLRLASARLERMNDLLATHGRDGCIEETSERPQAVRTITPHVAAQVLDAELPEGIAEETQELFPGVTAAARGLMQEKGEEGEEQEGDDEEGGA